MSTVPPSSNPIQDLINLINEQARIVRDALANIQNEARAEREAELEIAQAGSDADRAGREAEQARIDNGVALENERAATERSSQDGLSAQAVQDAIADAVEQRRIAGEEETKRLEAIARQEAAIETQRIAERRATLAREGKARYEARRAAAETARAQAEAERETLEEVEEKDSTERPHTFLRLTGENKSLSKYVISIDKFTNVGTGEIASAQIMLNTTEGQFISNTNNGDTPLLKPYDDFRLSVTGDNGVTYQRILYLDDTLPQQSGDGQITQFEFSARETYLKKMKIAGHFYFIRHVDMIKKIISYYNSKRGTLQPEIIYELNGVNSLATIPNYPTDVFNFGDGVNCYDALLDVVKKLSMSVSARGAGDFYELLFSEHPTDNNKLIIKIFPLGAGSDNPVLIEGKDVNTLQISEVKQPYSANIVVVSGKRETGFYPKNIGVYTAKIEEYDNFPEWENTEVYPKDAYIRYKNELYQSLSPVPINQNPTLPIFWKPISFADFVGVEFEYSQWTANKARLYRNYCSNPNNDFNVDASSPAFADSNLTIRDGPNYRNSAQFRIRRLEDIPNEYLYPSIPEMSGIADRLPDDTRVLLDSSLGALADIFQGDDQFGNPYKDSLIQIRNGKWIVIRNPRRYDEIAIETTGIVYMWENTFTTKNTADRRNGAFTSSTAGWQSMENQFLGLDCFHYPSSITNVDGLVMPRKKTATTNYNTNSGVQIEYEFTENRDTNILLKAVGAALGPLGPIILGTIESILDFFITRAAYNYGWWAVLFEVPFPKSTHGGIGEKVGELFGGTTKNKVSTLDLNNYNYTHDGKEGYDTDSSTDLSRLKGIFLRLNLDYLAGETRIPLVGNLPMRITMYDTENNVWVHDFKYRLLGQTQDIIVYFSDFRIYRARNPFALGGGDIVYNIITPELKVLEIFERRKVKKITIQWQESYDNDGRYSPANFGRIPAVIGSTVLGTIKTRGIIDAFGFIRDPIAIAKNDVELSKRHLMENIKEYTNVSNIEQLQKIGNADLDLSLFPKDNVTIKTNGNCDIMTGESIFLHEEDLTNLEDNTGTANTKKFAVKKINYTVNAANTNGGFVRTLTVVDRINL